MAAPARRTTAACARSASYTRGQRTSDLVAPPSIIVERLNDGPVAALLEPGVGTDRTWSAGARFNRTTSAHRLLAGVDLGGGSSTVQSVFAGRVGELVNGLPARVWDFTDPAGRLDLAPAIASRCSPATRFAVAAARDDQRRPAVREHRRLRRRARRDDRLEQPAAARRHPLDDAELLAAVGVRPVRPLRATGCRSRDLAYGDPTAPTANMSRWTRPPPTLPALLGVPRGAAGAAPRARAPAASPASRPSIRRLKRPTMDEMVLGFEARPRQNTFLRIAAIGRRDHNFVGVAERRRAGVDLLDDRRARHGHRHRRRRRRSDPALLQPLAVDLRRRPLPADQPGGRT